MTNEKTDLEVLQDHLEGCQADIAGLNDAVFRLKAWTKEWEEWADEMTDTIGDLLKAVKGINRRALDDGK